MIETISLCPGVTLRCCRDTRFKQGCLSVQLVRPMTRQESARNALLPTVLLRGTRRCPDLRAITQKLDALYGASVSALVRRVGDYQSTGLYTSFMDDRFALPGEAVLAPMVDFLRELLLDSPLENGGFVERFVESEKKNLISTIESQRNDKRVYAMSQLLKILCREDSFGLSRLGETPDVEAITPQALYSHYQTLLAESTLELFYVGSAESGDVARLLQPMLVGLSRRWVPLPEQTGFHPCQGQDVVQTMDVSQGKLGMGFVTPITNRSPRFAAMQVFNTLFGGGMTSKLFLNIREKRSLCYSVGSAYYGSKGIVTVSAGIDFDKEGDTRQQVLAQLKACQDGEISRQELTAAREAVISSLRATHDSPGAIEGYYATAALSGLNLTVPQYMQAVEAVTLDDVVAAARQLSLHSTYFLKGGCQ